MPNETEIISEEQLTQIAENIHTPAELLEYSRARRSLEQIQKKTSFL